MTAVVDGASGRGTRIGPVPVAQSRTASYSLAAPVMLFVIAVLLMIPASASRTPGTYALVLVFGYLCFSPFLTAYANSKKYRFDVFEPIHAILFLYFVYFAVRTVYVVNARAEPRLDFDGVLNQTLATALLGVVALCVGYYSPLARVIVKWLPTLRARAITRRRGALVYVLWAVGTVLRLGVISGGNWARYVASDVSASSVSMSNAAMMLGRIAFTLLAINYFSRRGSFRRSWFFWIVAFPAELAWDVMGGEKEQVVYLLLTLVFLYHYLRRRLALGAPLILTGATLLVVFPIITAYRAAGSTVLREGSSLQEIGGQTLEGLAESLSTEGIVDQAAYVLWRFPGLDSLATIMTTVPASVDFQWGQTISSKLAVFVPAVFLPNKGDLIKQGWIFNRDYFPADVHSDSPLMQLGELYGNFGMAGVVGGMFLFGVFYKTIYLFFVRSSGSLKYVVYVPLWFGIINIELDIGLQYAIIAREFLIALAIYWLMVRLSSRKGTTTGRPSLSADLTSAAGPLR